MARGEFLLDGPAGPRRGYAVRDGDAIWGHWAGTTFRFDVARGAGGRAARAAPAAVTSPMPGQVLRVLVEVGGTAHVLGRGELWLDPDDALGSGFLVR